MDYEEKYDTIIDQEICSKLVWIEIILLYKQIPTGITRQANTVERYYQQILQHRKRDTVIPVGRILCKITLYFKPFKEQLAKKKIGVRREEFFVFRRYFWFEVQSILVTQTVSFSVL